MANWSFITVDITGERQVLEAIYNAITACLDKNVEMYQTYNHVFYIFELLHINTKKFEERAYWSEPRFNKQGHLLITEQSLSFSHTRCAEALKQKFPFEISGINYYPA